MKISDNMSSGAFLWQLWILRVISISFLIFAIVSQQHFADLLAFSGISLGASLLFSRRRSNFLVEVYDCRDYLRLKLETDELLIKLHEIEKVEIRDGKDGLDWVVIYLCFEGKFGRLIQFYPDMVNVPTGRLDVWLAEFNRRISANQLAREC